MKKLQQLKPLQLLSLHSEIIEELRTRKILRSSNTPTGDLAEFLFCQAYQLNQAPNSQSQFDATNNKNERFQIKGRRHTKYNKSRLLSGLRNLPEKGFDYLAGVIFNEDYTVKKAVLIPFDLVLNNATHNKHTNSWQFVLADGIWDWPRVQDATKKLQNVLERK